MPPSVYRNILWWSLGKKSKGILQLKVTKTMRCTKITSSPKNKLEVESIDLRSMLNQLIPQRYWPQVHSQEGLNLLHSDFGLFHITQALGVCVFKVNLGAIFKTAPGLLSQLPSARRLPSD